MLFRGVPGVTGTLTLCPLGHRTQTLELIHARAQPDHYWRRRVIVERERGLFWKVIVGKERKGGEREWVMGRKEE